jgi:hypothetical protein
MLCQIGPSWISGRSLRNERGLKPKTKERAVPPFDIRKNRAKTAKAISKHPEIVERVKAQARENEDILTRTAPGLV